MVNFIAESRDDVTLDNGVVESTYMSENGRNLRIRKTKSYSLMHNSIYVYHYPEIPKYWGTTTENQIDNLISAMVSQRIEAEASFLLSSDTARIAWTPAWYFEQVMKTA